MMCVLLPSQQLKQTPEHVFPRPPYPIRKGVRNLKIKSQGKEGGCAGPKACLAHHPASGSRCSGESDPGSLLPLSNQ